MIHIFVGTKAQFIKMAPIMQELDRRGIDYNFIDGGQHGGLTHELIDQLNLRQPDVSLRDERDSIERLPQALAWTVRTIWRIWTRRERICEEVFRGEPGICLIHGDTLTTLVSLLYAKRCGLKIAHVEAGLRSYDILNPFPEEIVRLIAMRYSDVLFAPSDWAFRNLHEMGYAGKSVSTGANTVIDTVRYARSCCSGTQGPSEPYVVATTHRVETIYSRHRMEVLVAVLERIAQERKVLFVLHQPTRMRLCHFGFYDRVLSNPSIELLPLQPYLKFISLLQSADFIVTDGGSVQEEASFLGVPCLIMRSKTERLNGLGNNAQLAAFERDSIERFLDSWRTLGREGSTHHSYPSRVIIDYVVKELTT